MSLIKYDIKLRHFDPKVFIKKATWHTLFLDFRPKIHVFA